MHRGIDDSEFTEKDWLYLLVAMDTVVSHWRRIFGNAAVEGPRFGPTVPMAEVEAFEAASGICLPRSFVDLVTKFAGMISLRVRPTPGLETPSMYRSLGFSWSDMATPDLGYGGVFDSDTEATWLEEPFRLEPHWREAVEERLRWCEPWNPDPETRRFFDACFPLMKDDADEIVMCCARDPVEIRFLCHEESFVEDSGYLIHSGFRSFLLTWADCGFADSARLDTDIAGSLDPQHARVREMWKFIEEAPPMAA